MIGVKLTILMIVLTVMFCFGLRIYYEANPLIALKEYKTRNFGAKALILGILVILDVIGILYTIVYLLFLR